MVFSRNCYLCQHSMELLNLLSLLLFFVISFYAYLFYYNNSSQKPTKTGFKTYPIIGALPEFLKNRHRFLDWTTDVLADCPTNTATLWRPGKARGFLTANPLNVEHMLKTNFDNYPKGDLFTIPLHDFLGQGIFNIDGEPWKVQRKTASYGFNSKSLRNFVMDNVRVEIQTRLVPVLAKAAKTGHVLDLQDILERFAFDNVCKLTFNFDPCCLGDDGTVGTELAQAFEDATNLSSGRSRYAFPLLWKIKRHLNVGSERRLAESIAVVHAFADKIIMSRLAHKIEDEDLLSRFIQKEEISPEILRDIIISFILAGRDTTSSALSWFFWLLSSRPDVTKNILKELETIRVRNKKINGDNDTYSFDELRDMQYLHAAISESLRLYPPVPMDSKACQSDDTLPDGTIVRKGCLVTYHTYAMGRMESIWGKNSQEFLPERWLDENGICRRESPFRYPVFHAGPRMCLGKDLAYMQMKSIAATVIERFGIAVENKSVDPLLSLTLRVRGGLLVRVKDRCI
ncbi:putative Cytochrome P450 [Quillaja saponaria]|uniref:Cytochrome P450 n=1 Tax=Quillaja saponaria TaxID=32244 RepID=A0AAD7VDX1_QUISA|nr:putative Cytochrome P450 [Quillaja saponaria]